MGLRDWIRGGSRAGAEDDELGIDDLVLLERFDEATERLQARIKSDPKNLHAHLKLAEVYSRMRRGAAAVEEYVFVAEEYAQDGFYDKGIALLSKASRMNPLEDSLPLKIEALQMAKRLEHKRSAALEGLREGAADRNTAVEVQRTWHKLARSPVVQRLPADQLRRFFAGVELARHPASNRLAARGDRGVELWLILRGVVEARVMQDDGKAVGLRTFGIGDILGEVTFFERQPWPADYVATEDTLVLTLSRAGLEKALAGNPDPRGLLDTLRWQGNDRDVATSVAKLRGGGAGG